MRHSDRLLEIDGLRAIAVALVVAQHCNIMPIGWTGVWIFYVISGYVITRNFLIDNEKSESNSLQLHNFFIKRASRIIPVYLLYLAVGAIIYSYVRDPSYLSGVPSILTFTYNWFLIFQTDVNADSQIFSHLWSLSVEEQFYILYPIIFIFLYRKTYIFLILSLIILAPAIRYIYIDVMGSFVLPPTRASWAVYHSSIAQFDAFLVGAFIANWEPWIRCNPDRYVRIAGFVAACGAIYLVYVALRQYDEMEGWLRNLSINVYPGGFIGSGLELFIYSAINAITACVLILALLHARSLKFLSASLLVIVGRISYGVYLYHGLVFWLINYHVMPQTFAESSIIARVGWCAVVFVLSITIAYYSFYRFELPVMRVIRRRYLSATAPVAVPPTSALPDPP